MKLGPPPREQKDVSSRVWKEWLSSVHREINISGRVIQTQTTIYKTTGSGTGTIPLDDTTPTTSEGNTGFSATITPRVRGSIILVEFGANLDVAAAGAHATVAMFKDAETDAFATSSAFLGGVAHRGVVTGMDTFVTDTTDMITISLRYGANTSTSYINRRQAADESYGGTIVSYIKLSEIQE